MYSSSRSTNADTKTATSRSPTQNTSRRTSNKNDSVTFSRSVAKTSSDSHPDPERWWFHRRRGFYIGLWWAVLQTAVWVAIALYDVEVIDALGVVVGWCYAISATLIVAYYGNNAVESFSSRGMSGR